MDFKDHILNNLLWLIGGGIAALIGITSGSGFLAIVGLCCIGYGFFLANKAHEKERASQKRTDIARAKKAAEERKKAVQIELDNKTKIEEEAKVAEKISAEKAEAASLWDALQTAKASQTMDMSDASYDELLKVIHSICINASKSELLDSALYAPAGMNREFIEKFEDFRKYLFPYDRSSESVWALIELWLSDTYGRDAKTVARDRFKSALTVIVSTYKQERLIRAKVDRQITANLITTDPTIVALCSALDAFDLSFMLCGRQSENLKYHLLCANADFTIEYPREPEGQQEARERYMDHSVVKNVALKVQQDLGQTFYSKTVDAISVFADFIPDIFDLLNEAWAEEALNTQFSSREDFHASTGHLLGRGDQRDVNYNGEKSLITIAGPGSGKTQCHVLPNLNSFEGAAIVLDVKGECYDKSASWRREHVGPVFAFAPSNPDASQKYNPLQLMSEVDLSRFCAAPSARLGHFLLE
ncbi:cell envelope integrity protein TolA, partial [Pseudosulfitobacter sp. DSM 107133]